MGYHCFLSENIFCLFVLGFNVSLKLFQSYCKRLSSEKIVKSKRKKQTQDATNTKYTDKTHTHTHTHTQTHAHTLSYIIK